MTIMCSTHAQTDNGPGGRESNIHSSGMLTVSWMHIQKTSGWIGDFLLQKYCTNNSTRGLPGVARRRDSRGLQRKDKYKVKIHEQIEHNCAVNLLPESSFGFHFPNNGELLQPGTILTMFRRPVDRLISAYLFDPRGGMLPAGYPLRESQETTIHGRINNATVPVVAYASLPAIHSCQTKMLLGHPCGRDLQRELTAADEQEARRRLEQDLVAFGLTEDYPASFALFEAALASSATLGHLQDVAHPVHPTNTRIRKNARNDATTHQALQQQLEEHGWSDRHDELLYAAATVLFCQRCKAYNITTKIHCDQPNSSF